MFLYNRNQSAKNMKNNPHQEFLKWYEPLHEAFTRYCSSRACGLLETEDLVQESLLAVLSNFHKVEDKKRLLAYLFSVANNIVKNKKRRLKFHGNWDERVMEKLESRIQNPEIALDIHYLLKAIELLPARQKEALVLFEISGFNIREISIIQESSEAATKTRLSRARKKLAGLLSEDNPTMSLTQRLAIYASVLF